MSGMGLHLPVKITLTHNHPCRIWDSFLLVSLILMVSNNGNYWSLKIRKPVQFDENSHLEQIKQLIPA